MLLRACAYLLVLVKRGRPDSPVPSQSTAYSFTVLDRPSRFLWGAQDVCVWGGGRVWEATGARVGGTSASAGCKRRVCVCERVCARAQRAV